MDVRRRQALLLAVEYVTALKHSTDRYLWIGNMSNTNCQGNSPRYPLVIGEVDPKDLRLIKSTLLVVDTKRPDESGVNLSHWWGFEDRPTRDIVIVGARYSLDYNVTRPVVYRIAVGPRAVFGK